MPPVPQLENETIVLLSQDSQNEMGKAVHCLGGGIRRVRPEHVHNCFPVGSQCACGHLN